MHHGSRRRRRLWRRLRRDLDATRLTTIDNEVVPDFILSRAGLLYVAGDADDAPP